MLCVPPVALSTPLVSFSTTVNVSPASAPASLMLTPVTAAEWLTPTVRVVGAVIVGPLITVIPTSPAGALLPKLSERVTAIWSDPVTVLSSLMVPSAALTCVRVPVSVTLVVPPPDTPAPFALPTDKSPLVSLKETVNCSPVVFPDSPIEPILTATTLLAVMVCAPSRNSSGLLFTVTAISCWLALAPRLSLALTVMVSAAVLKSVSVSVSSVALTAVNEPEICSELVPEPLTPALSWDVAANSPALSASVTVKVSPLCAPPAWLTLTV